MPRAMAKKPASSETTVQKLPVKRNTRATVKKQGMGNENLFRNQKGQMEKAKTLRKNISNTKNRPTQEATVSSTSLKTETIRSTKNSSTVPLKKQNKRKTRSSEQEASSSTIDEGAISSTESNVKRKQVKRIKNKVLSSFRQTSLKESFLNQSKRKCLRPRRVPKNYHEETTRSETDISTIDKTDVNKQKVPIYKSIPLDNTVDNKDEIYDFKPSQEETRRKKKKPRQTVVQKLLKARAKQRLKENLAKKCAQPSVNIEKINIHTKVANTGNTNTQNSKQVEKLNPAQDKNVLVLHEDMPAHLNPMIETDESASSEAAGIISEVVERNSEKQSPKLMSSSEESLKENMDANNFMPFRPTNAFKCNIGENLSDTINQNSGLIEQNTKRCARPVLSSMENFQDNRAVVTTKNPSVTESNIYMPVQSTDLSKQKSAKNALEIPENNSVLLESNTSKENKKPVVVSVQNLKNKNITVIYERGSPTKPGGVNTRINISNNVANNSIFNASLSPIMKTSGMFDVGSPWRLPPLYSLSNIKNMYQSTPNNNKSEVLGRIRGNQEVKIFTTKAKSKDLVQKVNEPVNLENSSFGNNQKKRSSTGIRRFGTEITNINQSVHIENSTGSSTERIPESINQFQSTDSENTENLTLEEASKVDKTNKENSVLNYQTPKKIYKKNIKRMEMRSPLKPSYSHANKENIDAVPGPSGLQNMSIGQEVDQRVLRQSNLNNFLNIVNMPEVTTIKTRHGIFDDAHSPPISGKIGKKSEPQIDIDNAFGFADENIEQNSPVVDQNHQNQKGVHAMHERNLAERIGPVRLSIGEIKNHLNLMKTDKKDSNIEVQTNTRKNVKKSPTKRNVALDIANFSDTFDVLSETGDVSSNACELPLFADLEPCRFIEPPKHSYKRKREVKFSFSDDSESEEESHHPRGKAKRRKAGKLNKEEHKRLTAWVKNVNRTFDEIDQYDLIIE